MQIANAVGLAVVLLLALAAVVSLVIIILGGAVFFSLAILGRAKARAQSAYWEEIAQWSRRPRNDRHIPFQIDDACRAALKAFHNTNGRSEDRMLAAVDAWGRYARKYIKHGSFIPGEVEEDESSTVVDTSSLHRIERTTALTKHPPCLDPKPSTPTPSESDQLRPHTISPTDKR